MFCSPPRYGVMAVASSMAVVALAMSICGLGLSARAASPAQDVVRYRDFGARGDGKTDDIDAIVKAHAFANEHELPVKADDEATSGIKASTRSARNLHRRAYHDLRKKPDQSALRLRQAQRAQIASFTRWRFQGQTVRCMNDKRQTQRTRPGLPPIPSPEYREQRPLRNLNRQDPRRTCGVEGELAEEHQRFGVGYRPWHIGRQVRQTSEMAFRGQRHLSGGLDIEETCSAEVGSNDGRDLLRSGIGVLRLGLRRYGHLTSFCCRLGLAGISGDLCRPDPSMQHAARRIEMSRSAVQQRGNQAGDEFALRVRLGPICCHDVVRHTAA
jgi:hypothetical protein